jgi:hypothetical protein
LFGAVPANNTRDTNLIKEETMPPDISAGPMALAGMPGATAAGKGGEPPVSGVLSATLFASFLAQSSPPDLTAVPKITVPAVAKPFLNAILPASETLKTMDTLPKISLLSMGTAKSNASELPLHHTLASNAPAHKTTPDDTALTDARNAAIQAPSAAPAIAPNPALVPILVPPALLGLTLPLMLPASGGAAPQRASSAASVASVSVPMLSASAEASVPLRSAPNANPSLAGLPLPRIGTLTAQVSAAPQATTPVPQAVTTAAAAVPNADAKASAFPEISSARLSTAVPTRVLPNALGPVQSNLAQSNLAQSKDMAQAAPQAAVSLLRLPSVPAPAFLVSSSAAMSVTASVLVPPSVGGQALPAPTVPAKSNAKFAQIALKPTSENADNNTRTLSIEAPQVSAKTAAPVASLHQTSEASSEKPGLTSDLDAKKTAEPAAPPEVQALLPAAQATGADSKPLSAADHTEMVRQVADGVGAMPPPAKPGGVQQMSLQLHPKDWGSLQVSVSVTPGQERGDAKTVTAHIVAETPQVKAALQSQSGALHQALRASGLNLEHLTVSVKPASEVKAPEVKSAGGSASAGFSSDQGQPNAQGQSNAGSSQAQAGTPSGTAFSGGGQDARQGQTQTTFVPAPTQAEPELDDINVVRLPMRPVAGRIDTHA